MLIYISHPFQGKPENAAAVERIIGRLIKGKTNDTYISPIHALGFMYDLVSYERGLDMCLELLGRCDEMLVFGKWQQSRGCRTEIAYCNEHNISYRVMEG